jgi:tight adherence protein B
VGSGFVFAGGDNGSAKAVKRAQGLRVQTSSKLDRRSAKTSDPAQRRKQILLQLKEAERRQRKAHVSLRAKLQQTGLSVTPLQFWIGSLVLGMVVMALAAALMRNPLIAVAAGFVAGLGLPRWLMSFIGKRRTKKFTASFADAVDIIVRGIKSGLPVHDCLKIIARETEKPLGPEFTAWSRTSAWAWSCRPASRRCTSGCPRPSCASSPSCWPFRPRPGATWPRR